MTPNRMKLETLQLKLQMASPQAITKEQRMRILTMEDRLTQAMERILSEQKSMLKLFATRLDALSPLARLKQGYAYVTTPDGHALTRSSQVKQGDALRIYLQDGTVETQVCRVTSDRRTV